MGSFRCLEVRGKQSGHRAGGAVGLCVSNAFSTRPELHVLTAGAEQVVQGPRAGEAEGRQVVYASVGLCSQEPTEELNIGCGFHMFPSKCFLQAPIPVS